jgi:hypothetical protein
MNQAEFDALTSNGTVKELKAELALLREARKALDREDARITGRMRELVVALAQRQEEAVK